MDSLLESMLQNGDEDINAIALCVNIVYDMKTDNYIFVMLNSDNDLYVLIGQDLNYVRRTIPDVVEEKETHPFLIAIDEGISGVKQLSRHCNNVFIQHY